MNIPLSSAELRNWTDTELDQTFDVYNFDICHADIPQERDFLQRCQDRISVEINRRVKAGTWQPYADDWE